MLQASWACIRSWLATVKIIKCRDKVGSESSEWLVKCDIKDDKAIFYRVTLLSYILLRNHKHGKQKTISEAKSGYLKRNKATSTQGTTPFELRIFKIVRILQGGSLPFFNKFARG